MLVNLGTIFTHFTTLVHYTHELCEFECNSLMLFISFKILFLYSFFFPFFVSFFHHIIYHIFYFPSFFLSTLRTSFSFAFYNLKIFHNSERHTFFYSFIFLLFNKTLIFCVFYSPPWHLCFLLFDSFLLSCQLTCCS